MTVPISMLNELCPMHVVLKPDGRILQAGPTLRKLDRSNLLGASFFDIVEVNRPRAVQTMAQLLASQGRKLHMRLRNGRRTPLKGHLLGDGSGGAVLNLSFGIAVMDAVRDYALTARDFSPIDPAVELLYLVEAKSAAMNASLRLNDRLQDDKVAAEKRAFTDTLTGLRNRRAMDHVLERLDRSGGVFSLLHLDLDFFKQVNDTMGHAAGDAVLRRVAQIMMEETRKDDTVARVGGDEFVIVIPNATSKERLAALSRRLISRIEQPVDCDGRSAKVSASIGISSSEGEPNVAARILEEADVALYASKRAGRAQFAFFGPEAGSSTAPKSDNATAAE